MVSSTTRGGAGGTRFLDGGGEMGAIIRAHDWAETSLGAPSRWPQTLRTSLRLMLNTRHPMMVLWGRDLLQFYNDAYAESLGPQLHPAMLGQPCRAWWPDAPAHVWRQLDQVLAGDGAVWEEEQLVPVRRDGRPEDTWWTYSYSPIDDEAEPDGIAGVLVVCQDVTRQRAVREALQESEARWRRLFENMHEGFALCELVYGPDGVACDWRYLEVNRALERLRDIPAERLVGRLASEVIPGLERHWIETYTRVAETGVPAHAVLEVASLGHWYEIFAYRTEPGRFAVLFLNATERRAAEKRQQMLMREVDHRAKNLLAVVQAAVRLTRSGTVEEYRECLAGRLAALARMQTLFAERGWSGAWLGEVVGGELEAAGGAGRVEVDGPTLMLSATVAQPLAMALHELAANAARHGALSAPRGRVEVRWRREPGDRLVLRWREQGGPGLRGAPAERGFGMRMIEAAVARQLGGQVALRWDAPGLDCLVQVPLGRTVAETGMLAP